MPGSAKISIFAHALHVEPCTSSRSQTFSLGHSATVRLPANASYGAPLAIHQKSPAGLFLMPGPAKISIFAHAPHVEPCTSSRSQTFSLGHSAIVRLPANASYGAPLAIHQKRLQLIFFLIRTRKSLIK